MFNQYKNVSENTQLQIQNSGRPIKGRWFSRETGYSGLIWFYQPRCR